MEFSSHCQLKAVYVKEKRIESRLYLIVNAKISERWALARDRADFLGIGRVVFNKALN